MASIVEIIIKATDKASESFKGIGNAFKSLTGVSLSAAAGIGLATKAFQFIVSEGSQAQLVSAKLNAVLKATGGAAGMTSESLNDLANGLSMMSGVEDDTILNSEAVLLTFRDIGSNIFPQAEQAALDMSAVLGGDLQSSVLQLGKALNDPIKGMTALRRSGVSFTQEQIAMVTQLQNTGDMLGAQNIILDEMQKEFGGAAAAMGDTYVGAVNKLKTAIGNLAEEAASVPIAGRNLLEWMTDGINSGTELIYIFQHIEDAQYNSFSAQRDQIALTSTSYDDYSEKAYDAAVANNRLDASTMILRARTKDYSLALTEEAGELGFLSLKEYEAGVATGDFTIKTEASKTKLNDTAIAANALGTSLYELSPAADDAANAFDPLKAELDTLKSSMGELTTQMLFNKAAEGLSAEATLALQRSMGLLDEGTYYVLEGVEQLKEQFLAGVISEQQYTDGVMELTDKTNLLAPSLDRSIQRQEAFNDNFIRGSTLANVFTDHMWSVSEPLDQISVSSTRTTTNLKGLEGGLRQATTPAQALSSSLNAIPPYVYSHVVIETTTIKNGIAGNTLGFGWGMPANQVPVYGGVVQVPNAGGANGLDMIVPQGFKNDSFMVGATSGERVTIDKDGGRGGQVINININGPVYGSKAAIEVMMRDVARETIRAEQSRSARA
jgi:hypothetical protein